ncbi:MAG: pyridoxal phosphate-dependent aminotransferase family protein [Verrucomicrobia bacterium]|nr:pyridoxal phosphate-dependent aminotransferase family protein [Verrucomicrobiota bacterium]
MNLRLPLSGPASVRTDAPASLPDPLGGTWRDFHALSGPDLARKTVALAAWTDARVRGGSFPFARRLTAAPGPSATLRGLNGVTQSGLNFCSQDYLALASHPEITHAACTAIARHGVHSAGSAALAGGLETAEELESLLAEHLAMTHVILCPSGWAAGYGSLRALVRTDDHVVIDAQAGNCLREGAAAATTHVHRYRHLDLAHARDRLAAIRARDPDHGILVATESLFATDATSPDFTGLHLLCREFDALLLVDMAHDFGCLGPGGTGHLGRQGLSGKADIVVGSFAKSLATNGGFVATRRRDIREYLRFFAPPVTFSNALSPLQVAVALAALRIVRSPEGDRRRHGLLCAANALRGGLAAHGVPVLGLAGPLVPAHVGRGDIARMAAKFASDNGVLVNLVEPPLVPRDQARFRLQVSSAHEPAACESAAGYLADAITCAARFCHHRAKVA